MKQFISKLQPMGRALMLPIAVLPVAALLLRLGQPDLLDMPAIAAAGDAIFSNLGLLFAIGVAVGLARENHGAAGLASVVGYLVATQGARVLIEVPPEADRRFAGPAVDLAAAAFRDKELVQALRAAGPAVRACSPAGPTTATATSACRATWLFSAAGASCPSCAASPACCSGWCFGVGWPVVEHGMDATEPGGARLRVLGLFAYGVLNRVLIVTGLHHIINNIAWFLLGDYNGVTGDLKRFFAGDPSRRRVHVGILPGHDVRPAGRLSRHVSHRAPEQRKAVGGMLLSMALTSFLTGVTEPIEFSFMFLAPLLYAIHAVLTGIAMALMHALGVHLGFGFSAGLFDYVLNFSLSTRPWLLIPVGLAYFGLYYGLFRYFIVRFDLKTLGRETDEARRRAPNRRAIPRRPMRWIHALGSAANLRSVEACTTRLRLVVDGSGAHRRARASRRSARAACCSLADGAVQVVVGPIADQLASEIRDGLRTIGAARSRTVTPRPARHLPATSPADAADSRGAAALGGRGNIVDLHLGASRLCISVRDPAAVDDAALAQAVRAVARPAPGSIHLVLGPAAASWFAEMKAS